MSPIFLAVLFLDNRIAVRAQNLHHSRHGIITCVLWPLQGKSIAKLALTISIKAHIQELFWYRRTLHIDSRCFIMIVEFSKIAVIAAASLSLNILMICFYFHYIIIIQESC